MLSAQLSKPCVSGTRPTSPADPRPSVPGPSFRPSCLAETAQGGPRSIGTTLGIASGNHLQACVNTGRPSLLCRRRRLARARRVRARGEPPIKGADGQAEGSMTDRWPLVAPAAGGRHNPPIMSSGARGAGARHQSCVWFRGPSCVGSFLHVVYMKEGGDHGMRRCARE